MIVLYSEGKSVFAVALPTVFTRLWTCRIGSANNNSEARRRLSRKVNSSVSQTSAYTTETTFKNKKQ